MKKLLILALLPASALAKPPSPPPVAIAPFFAADLVWAIRGPAVLGPESAPAIDHALTEPAELIADCKVGDLTLKADSVAIAVTCAGAPLTFTARIASGEHALLVEAPAQATDVARNAAAALQHRLDVATPSIPLRRPSMQAAQGTKLPPEVELWQHAAESLRVGDLSAAATATDLALAAGPANLTRENRLDAAIVATGVGRTAALKRWLGDAKKYAPLDPEGLAVRALLGQRKAVLAQVETCLAPEDRPACDVKPLLRVLIAQRAWPEAAHILQVRIEHKDPDVEDVRLALGVAQLLQDPVLIAKWAGWMTRLRRDDPAGWHAAALTHLGQGDAKAALKVLLDAPDTVAKEPETLEIVVRVVDALLDPLSVAALDKAATDTLRTEVAASKSRVGRLAAVVIRGWQGDPAVATELATLEGADTLPLLLSLRALALLAVNQPAQAAALAAKAQQLAPENRHVAEARFQLSLLTGVDAGILAAYQQAERVSLDANGGVRAARAQVAAELRGWDLMPPVRWPLALAGTR